MRRIRPDIIIISAALAAAAILWFSGVFSPGGTGSIAVIELKNSPVARLPLDTPAELHLECGNVVKVENGSVHMSSASCPDKTCVERGEISRVGETVVCLPNKVVIRIEAPAQ